MKNLDSSSGDTIGDVFGMPDLTPIHEAVLVISTNCCVTANSTTEHINLNSGPKTLDQPWHTYSAAKLESLHIQEQKQISIAKKF